MLQKSANHGYDANPLGGAYIAVFAMCAMRVSRATNQAPLRRIAVHVVGTVIVTLPRHAGIPNRRSHTCHKTACMRHPGTAR